MEIIKEYTDSRVNRKLCLVKNNEVINGLFNEPGLYEVSKYFPISDSHMETRIITKIGIDENILISNIDSCTYINIPNRNTISCIDSLCDHKIGCINKYYRCNETNNNEPTFYICPITLNIKRV